jgi:hypothetical protein
MDGSWEVITISVILIIVIILVILILLLPSPSWKITMTIPLEEGLIQPSKGICPDGFTPERDVNGQWQCSVRFTMYPTLQQLFGTHAMLVDLWLSNTIQNNAANTEILAGISNNIDAIGKFYDDRYGLGAGDNIVTGSRPGDNIVSLLKD